MIFYGDDQIVVDVQFHLRVDDSHVAASDQAWMSFLLNTHTIFSFFSYNNYHQTRYSSIRQDQKCAS